MLSRRATIVLVAGSLFSSSLPAFARGASFQAIDSNRDGALDLDEIKKAASAKFDALDRNRTGTLSRREIGRLRLSRKDFAAGDPDKDGTLTKDEYLAIVEQRTCALADENRVPRLVPLGCNFDGGLTWLALGKASAGPELDSFRVEIPDADLERVDATISPSSMDMFMPYGQGPVVGPISVSSASRSLHGPLTVCRTATWSLFISASCPRIRTRRIFYNPRRSRTFSFSTTGSPVVGGDLGSVSK